MRPALLFALAALASAGCRRETALPSGPPHPDTTPPDRVLTAVATDSQRGVVGATFPIPLEVAVRDTAGHGVEGALVQFAVIGTNARLTPTTGIVRTGSDGHATVTVTFGPRAGAVRVVAASASAEGVAAFDLVATPSPALTLFALEGDSQIVALPGSTLGPFVVAVRDTFGNLVTARPVVVFRVAAGVGTFGGRDTVAIATDSAGEASASLTSPAPPDGDTVRLTASFAGMAKPPLPAVAVALAFRGKAGGAGAGRVCAVATGGAAYCWGSGSAGALGTGDTTDRSTPTAVVSAPAVLAVDVGAAAGCGLTPSGAATCWGSPTFGGSAVHDVPFRALSVGSNAACGISSSGSAVCWGSRPLPRASAGTTVPGPARFVAVSVGSAVACALSREGRAYCWGDNWAGALGTGDAASSPLYAVPVAGGLSFQSLGAGAWHVCGLTAAGAAYCWGLNASGQLGNGTTDNGRIPEAVAGGLTFTDISAGDSHTCAVTPMGAAYCWGYNRSGQLGTGNLRTSLVPVPVTGGVTFASISAGDDFTCGVAVGGATYCWGGNGHGQLGTGTLENQTSPTPVTGGLLFQPAPHPTTRHGGPARR